MAHSTLHAAAEASLRLRLPSSYRLLAHKSPVGQEQWEKERVGSLESLDPRVSEQYTLGTGKNITIIIVMMMWCDLGHQQLHCPPKKASSCHHRRRPNDHA
jgi:hypothetical protein